MKQTPNINNILDDLIYKSEENKKILIKHTQPVYYTTVEGEKYLKKIFKNFWKNNPPIV